MYRDRRGYAYETYQENGRVHRRYLGKCDGEVAGVWSELACYKRIRHYIEQTEAEAELKARHIGDIQEVPGLPQSTVSRHLALLRTALLV